MTPRVLALVPTISRSRVVAASPWLRALRREGIDVRIVANAASVAAAATELDAPVIDTGANPGFARSILAALAAVDEWDWVVLLNDDLILGDGVAAHLRSAIAGAADRRDNPADLLYFDPEPMRPLPGRWGVFVSVSLLEALGVRFARRVRVRPRARLGYKSFSAVAIHRDAWTRAGGLDARLIFCFEDALFVRNHRARGGAEPVSIDVGISHEKSTTTSRHIARVLPAVAFSARRYLEVLGTPARVAGAIVVAALIVRLPLVVFASAPPRAHLLGIVRAARAVASGREPSLPPYELL